MPLTPGTKFGPYEIIGPLGAGGMGEVYRAKDGRLQRNVAIKLLPPMLAADPSLRARFEQEARALAALNHPNIVAIYDVGEDEGRVFMVSELVEGESLRSVLEGGLIPVKKANDLAVQMADGMAAAHALGIVHRDLKPENVMVTPAGVVKVLDFGLAKQSSPSTSGGGDKTATMALSQPGTVMGTAGYMSPEQVRAEAVDARSDIFSFGCVLYEMLTGQRAFHSSSSAVETMHAVLSSEPAELEADNSKLSPAHAVIVRRCLEKRPEQRFQSAADLAFALRSLSGTTTSAAPAPVVRQQKPLQRIPIWPIAAGLGALSLIAGGYFARGLFTKVEPEHFQRLTFREGVVSNARFTADGRNVVYSARWEGGASRIYLSVPGSAESRDLGLEDVNRILAVSSKDELLVLTRNGTLIRTSLSGGQPRPLVENTMDADWSPDGSSVAVLRRSSDSGRLEYPIGTVLIDKISWPIGSVRVSPDGMRVAFLQKGPGTSTVLKIADRAGKIESLGQIGGQTDSSERSALAWTVNGGEIWFRSFDQGDVQTIHAIDMKGRKRVVANLPGKVGFFDRSKDNLLLSTGSTQFGIMGTAPGDATEHDLSCLDQGILKSISDDGRLILASVSGDSGGPKGSMYVRKTDGSPAVRLGDGSAMRLSPDGKWVSGYSLQDDGSRKFGAFPTGAGSSVPLEAPGMQLSAIMGWLETDSRQLITGAMKGHKWSCFAFDSEAKTLKQICPEGVPQSFSFFVSPDKRYVLAEMPGYAGYAAYAVDGSPAVAVKGILDQERPLGWTADGRAVYVSPVYASGATVPVSIVDIATGRRSLWKELRMSHPQEAEAQLNLQITPDGKAYAYNFSELRSSLYLAKGLR